MTKKAYEPFIKSIIKNDKVITITPDDINAFGFERVNMPSKITPILAGARDIILSKFFNNSSADFYMIKGGEYVENWNETIYSLF